MEIIVAVKNKKVVAGVGVAAVAAAALALGAGTFASFTDAEGGPSGTLAAGTLDLGTTQASKLFEFANIAPGFSETKTVPFTNAGSLPGNLEVAFTLVGDENGCIEPEGTACAAGAGNLAESVDVTIVGSDGTSLGPVKASTLDDAPLRTVLAANATVTYTITASIDRNVGNEIQSDTLAVASTATLNQQ